MSDLSSTEKLKIEKLFGMGSGYVINFSNKTFSEFVMENVGIEIIDSKYEYASNSKANRLRKFWQIESNAVVGKLLSALLEYWKTDKQINDLSITLEEQSLYTECLKIVDRLKEENLIQFQDDVLVSSNQKRPIKVFLSHAHSDAKAVRAIYNRLTADGVDAWLDKEKLLPGQDWELEIRKAVRAADVVVVCLSKHFNQAGFRQKEVRLALDTAMEQPEGEIFIIPARLEECDMLESLRKWHWVDLFEDDGYELLIRALQVRANNIDATLQVKKRRHQQKKSLPQDINKSDSDKKTVVKRSNRKPKYLKGDEPVEILAPSDHISPAGLISSSDSKDFESISINSNSVIRASESLKKEQASSTSTPPSRSSDLDAPTKDGSKSVVNSSTKKVRPKLKTEYIVALIGAAATIIAGILGSPLIEKWLQNTPMPSSLPNDVGTQSPSFSEIIDAKGVQMVFVPAGEFTMGSNDGGQDEKPVHNVYLSDYYIDKFEVTNALYTSCVDVGVCEFPKNASSYTRDNYYENPLYADNPVLYIDWDMANTYCGWRGGRLPTEAEWEKAARGVDARVFPWGDKFDGSLTNFCDTNCTFSWADKEFNDGFADTTKVGTYSGGISYYGVYDMAGNVWEWTSSLYRPYPYNMNDGRENIEETGSYTLRGGSWGDQSFSLRTTKRDWFDETNEMNSIGFRCASTIDLSRQSTIIESTSSSSDETVTSPDLTQTSMPVDTPLPTEITDEFGVEMLLISAGEFAMGSNSSEDDEKPATKIYLDAYYIDK